MIWVTVIMEIYSGDLPSRFDIQSELDIPKNEKILFPTARVT